MTDPKDTIRDQFDSAIDEQLTEAERQKAQQAVDEVVEKIFSSHHVSMFSEQVVEYYRLGGHRSADRIMKTLLNSALRRHDKDGVLQEYGFGYEDLIQHFKIRNNLAIEPKNTLTI